MSNVLKRLKFVLALLSLSSAMILLLATVEGFWGYLQNDFACLEKPWFYFALVKVSTVWNCFYLFVPWSCEVVPNNFERFVAVFCALSLLLLSWLTGSYFVINC